MNEKYIITIGRQLGSGGRTIGEQLARRLGINCYNKELIMRASDESGLSRSFFEKVDEEFNPVLTGGLLSDFFQDHFSNESFFQIQSEVIREIAAQESAVIVGRCADYVLREHPRCLNIFVSADTCDRIKHVAGYQNISEEKARAVIEKMDKKRASFYNYFSNKEWGSARSYDLCINSSALGLEKTTDLIQELVRMKFGLE